MDAGALVAGFYENFNNNEVGAAVAAFSEELETIDPGMGTVHGIEPFREYLETFKRAMPDARAVIEQQYESGLITPDERHEMITEIWTEATEAVIIVTGPVGSSDFIISSDIRAVASCQTPTTCS